MGDIFITIITFFEEFWTNFLVQNRSGLLVVCFILLFLCKNNG